MVPPCKTIFSQNAKIAFLHDTLLPLCLYKKKTFCFLLLFKNSEQSSIRQLCQSNCFGWSKENAKIDFTRPTSRINFELYRWKKKVKLHQLSVDLHPQISFKKCYANASKQSSDYYTFLEYF